MRDQDTGGGEVAVAVIELAEHDTDDRHWHDRHKDQYPHFSHFRMLTFAVDSSKLFLL